LAERKGLPNFPDVGVKPDAAHNKEDQSSSFEEVVEEEESKNDSDEECVDFEDPNGLEEGTEVEECLAIVGIASRDIMNCVPVKGLVLIA